MSLRVSNNNTKRRLIDLSNEPELGASSSNPTVELITTAKPQEEVEFWVTPTKPNTQVGQMVDVGAPVWVPKPRRAPVDIGPDVEFVQQGNRTYLKHVLSTTYTYPIINFDMDTEEGQEDPFNFDS